MDSFMDVDAYLLFCDDRGWLWTLLTSPSGVPHASRSGTRGMAMGGKGRG